MNTYILYTIYDKSIYLMMGYFTFYLWFYNYIILSNREIVKNNASINEITLVNKNLYLNYFNSCIGNFQDKYINIIDTNNLKINDYNLNNKCIDQIYFGTLQIFQNY